MLALNQKKFKIWKCVQEQMSEFSVKQCREKCESAEVQRMLYEKRYPEKVAELRE